MLQHVQPGELGQHQVQEHHAELLGRPRLVDHEGGRGAILDGEYAESFGRQKVGQHLANDRVVLHDEHHMARAAHQSAPSTRPHSYKRTDRQAVTLLGRDQDAHQP